MTTNQFLVALLALVALAASHAAAAAGAPAAEQALLGPGGRLPVLETTDGNSWRDVTVKQITASHVIFRTQCDAEIPVAEIVSPRLDQRSVGRNFAEIRLRSGRVFRDASLAGFFQVGDKKMAVLLFRCEQRVALAKLEHRFWWRICREIPIVELLTRSGLRYRQVYIRDVKVERLLIFHEKGVSWVPLRELPGSLRERVESRQTAIPSTADTAPVGELNGSDQIITTLDGTIYRNVAITGHSEVVLRDLPSQRGMDRGHRGSHPDVAIRQGVVIGARRSGGCLRGSFRLCRLLVPGRLPGWRVRSGSPTGRRCVGCGYLGRVPFEAELSVWRHASARAGRFFLSGRRRLAGDQE